MLWEAVVVGIIMSAVAVFLVSVHYCSVRAETSGPLSTVGIMLMQYLFFGMFLFLLVSFGGCFNKVLVPY